MDKGSKTIDGILELAKESEILNLRSRGNLIKQVAEVTEKLGDLQTKMHKLKEVQQTLTMWQCFVCRFHWTTKNVKGKMMYELFDIDLDGVKQLTYKQV